MPVNDEIFEFGKNIHALASYYLRKQNIDKMERSLTPNELNVWSYLKSSKYFAYEVINTEYNLAVKIANHYFGGRLDALMKHENRFYILDYKTGNAPKNAKYDYQTIIYTLAVKEFFNNSNVTFVYLDLRNKEEVIVEYKPELENEYKEILISAAKKIDNYELAPKKPNCKCEYSSICF